jgi:hypothetical protein
MDQIKKKGCSGIKQRKKIQKSTCVEASTHSNGV